jgi:hypothetical protein
MPRQRQMAASVYHPKELQGQDARAAFSLWHPAFEPIPRPRQLSPRVEIELLVNARAGARLPRRVHQESSCWPLSSPAPDATEIVRRSARWLRPRGVASTPSVTPEKPGVTPVTAVTPYIR